ncbi:MAG: hypothetical protein ACYDCC_06790 [Actinomycetota bacterium]
MMNVRRDGVMVIITLKDTSWVRVWSPDEEGLLSALRAAHIFASET